MGLPKINSIKIIEQQYRTGEEPVLVMCSDMNAYVCKYMRSSSASYKLVCELIGVEMANAWQLNTPDAAFVQIKPEHWANKLIQHSISAPSLGSRHMVSVVDLTPSTLDKVEKTEDALRQLIKIALFDFWIANEDRNANNANLMYDISNGEIISIDYGCILNTATFDFPMSQLTSTDTILWSDLFSHLTNETSQTSILKIVAGLKKEYASLINRSALQAKLILEEIPKEWNVSIDLVKNKILQMFDEKWTTGVWNNFIECLNENLGYELF
jgi:hypothetical protein